MADPVITVLETRSVPLKDLSPYPANPRNGDIDLIRESIRAHGQYRAMVVNRRSMQVLAGNHLLHAMLAEGFTEGLCHFVDVDDEEAARIVLVDNRASDLGKYDDGLLAQLLESLPDLSGTGYDDRALQDLLGSLGPKEGLTDPDEVPELPKEAVTKPGDLWILGEHRLLCGDAFTDLKVLLGGVRAAILLTDPPYGIGLDTDYRSMVGPKTALLGSAGKQVKSKQYRRVIGDDRPFDASSLREQLGSTKEQFWFGADYYRRTLSTDDRDGSWLVWDKRSETADAGYGSGFELVWSAQRHKRDLLRHFYFGAFGSEASNREHPTQKPSKLLAEILERWGGDAGVVLDPFAGSGSTLIAAHQLDRVAYLMEIDPLYCDVICRRFQEFSGIVPKRESGEEVSFIPELE